MTGASFVQLFAWEWRRVGANPVLWAVLAMLAASFVWGALDTARLHAAQTRAQERNAAAESTHRTEMQRRATAYAAPATADAPEVPYWQDPTSVAGFSQYFLFVHAVKPHLPLSPLAAGVSDTAPSRLPVRLNAVFGVDDTYDFENPRGLVLGRFDLGFALAYLLPLALILLFGLLITFERDRGMLRLIAAQTTGPCLWLGARAMAIIAWTVPTVLATLVVALAVAGVPFGAVAPELVAALLLTCAYVLFWSGLAVLILSRLPGAAGGLGALAAAWVLLAVGAPVLGSLAASKVAPASSPVSYVDARRRATDAIEVESRALLRTAFAARADLKDLTEPVLDHATELTFLTPEKERRLAGLRMASEQQMQRQAEIATLAGYAAPPMGLESRLAVLAGTDPERHRRFTAAARGWQLRLRDYFYPLVQREISRPTPRQDPPTRGRLNYGFGPIPGFVLVEQSATGRAIGTLPFAAWLTALGCGLAAIGLSRSRTWPADL